MNKLVQMRMSEETREKVEQQSRRFGLNMSEYIRMLIHLDVAAVMMKKIKREENV